LHLVLGYVDNFTFQHAARHLVDAHPHMLTRLQALNIYIIDQQHRSEPRGVAHQAHQSTGLDCGSEVRGILQ
jgi:hypothetical protein